MVYVNRVKMNATLDFELVYRFVYVRGRSKSVAVQIFSINFYLRIYVVSQAYSLERRRFVSKPSYSERKAYIQIPLNKSALQHTKSSREKKTHSKKFETLQALLDIRTF